MAMSAFQKMTLVSCLVLCVALLLPKMLLSRGKPDGAPLDGGPGSFPPMMHRQNNQKAGGARFSRAHNTEAIARAKGGGVGTGMGTGGKSNLAGQIIPIYGFGILLYILYILFKITSKGNISKPSERKFSALRSENTKRKISDYELAQLQEKLKETEEVMEKIVCNAGHSLESRGVSVDQEQRLLLQLKEITRVMQEGQLVEPISPKKRAEEARLTRDWDGIGHSHDNAQ
ncbi:protein RIC-3b isoform X2 [Denticeps clupeoides]|uniref:protein RIC-3b isoform X2 n=1 Tax=Denticeps clupeoides TaxID=299321 RepID=UPI0010A34182|nr:protein RIC-3-like isoform X2 [Denticeps clupeoides]